MGPEQAGQARPARHGNLELAHQGGGAEAGLTPQRIDPIFEEVQVQRGQTLTGVFIANDP